MSTGNPLSARDRLAAPALQTWGRLGLDPISAAAWSEAFRRQKKSVQWRQVESWSQARETQERFTSPMSGWIVDCSASQFAMARPVLEAIRRTSPQTILVGWSYRVPLEWRYLYMEAGVQVLCHDFAAMQTVANLAAKKAIAFPLETDPILREIQQMLPPASHLQAGQGL